MKKKVNKIFKKEQDPMDESDGEDEGPGEGGSESSEGVDDLDVGLPKLGFRMAGMLVKTGVRMLNSAKEGGVVVTKPAMAEERDQTNLSAPGIRSVRFRV